MATPAINNLAAHFPSLRMTAIASPLVAELFAGDPRFEAVIADTTRKSRFRMLAARRLAKEAARAHGPFDLAIAFPNSFSSRMLLWWSGARQRVGRSKMPGDLLLTHAAKTVKGKHLVETYNEIVCSYLGEQRRPDSMTLHIAKSWRYERPTIGINPGATYGSAKRWSPARFAEVAAALSNRHDIVIFGSQAEAPMADEIAATLVQSGVGNFTNVAGKTSLAELVGRISDLTMFITNDSGPMHIATALQVPTVAIFGPTNDRETSPWGNPNAVVVRHQLPCAPCMKRVCPLGHHACMNDIASAEVIAAAERILGDDRWRSDIIRIA